MIANLLQRAVHASYRYGVGAKKPGRLSKTNDRADEFDGPSPVGSDLIVLFYQLHEVQPAPVAIGAVPTVPWLMTLP